MEKERPLGKTPAVGGLSMRVNGRASTCRHLLRRG